MICHSLGVRSRLLDIQLFLILSLVCGCGYGCGFGYGYSYPDKITRPLFRRFPHPTGDERDRFEVELVIKCVGVELEAPGYDELSQLS